MKKLLSLYILFLILWGIPEALYAQSSIVLKSPQTTGGTFTACNLISLQPGFSYSASVTGTSLILSVDPAYCNFYGNIGLNLSKDINYIHTRTYISGDGSRYLDKIDYFDAFGRLNQSVQRGITPTIKDLVTHYEYKKNGIENRTWLPGVSEGNGAHVLPSAIESSSKNLNNDQKPYSIEYNERSTQQRPLKQTGPGEIWHNTSGGKSIVTQYLLNRKNMTEYLSEIDFFCKKSTEYEF